MFEEQLTKREQDELRLSKVFLIAAVSFGLLGVVWFGWVKSRPVHSFASCAAANNVVEQIYPQVCVTKDGKRFVAPH